MERIFTSLTASISELKKNPMAIIDNNEPVAILNRNKAVFYCVPADKLDKSIRTKLKKKRPDA